MDVEYKEIEIRNQRTKWGSCSSSGTLGLNWRLMMAPSEIIDYVVIHELAHLREPNHTNEFWRLVSKYDPDYAEHADWLDEHSTQLIFSNDDLRLCYRLNSFREIIDCFRDNVEISESRTEQLATRKYEYHALRVTIHQCRELFRFVLRLFHFEFEC